MKILKTLLRKKTKVIDGKVWKLMSPEELNAVIFAKDRKPDGRVCRLVISGGYRFYRLESDLTKNEFLSLIWHEINDSRVLTPENESRTVLDVAQRMEEGNHTFESLSQYPSEPINQHDPCWFCRCVKIYNKFTYNKFGAMWLKEPKPDERKQSPSGTYYIYDGCHRSLVLGKRLLEGEKYDPVKAILIDPKRKKKN